MKTKKRQMFVTVDSETAVIEFDDKFDFYGFIKAIGKNGCELQIIPEAISLASTQNKTNKKKVKK